MLAGIFVEPAQLISVLATLVVIGVAALLLRQTFLRINRRAKPVRSLCRDPPAVRYHALTRAMAAAPQDGGSGMEAVIVIVAFAPLVLLIWALVRHAGRIRRDAIDKESRTEQLDNLNPAITRFVLERDRHTCQRCGTMHQVGVDFRGNTPAGAQEITADDLEASCSRCFLGQWKTLQGTPGTDAERTGTLPRLW